MNNLVKIDPDNLNNLMATVHDRLAERDLPYGERSLTAKNYDSSISAFIDWMHNHKEKLPEKTVLEKWRRDMIREVSVRTANARLSAVRKLLRSVADDTTDIQLKLVLESWSKVENAKEIQIADKVETDYGVRLTLQSVERLIRSVDITTIRGLRDRALLAVMLGGGLRVSEAVNLTTADVFETANEAGQRGIKVRIAKHHKSRIVILDGWNSWVLTAVQAYTMALGLTGNVFIFRPVKYVKGGKWVSLERKLSVRSAQETVKQYQAEYQGAMREISAHDCRRTYAKLCKLYGMSWEALRDNMGHGSVLITEDYVGKDVDWSERIPQWTINL